MIGPCTTSCRGANESHLNWNVANGSVPRQPAKIMVGSRGKICHIHTQQMHYLYNQQYRNSLPTFFNIRGDLGMYTPFGWCIALEYIPLQNRTKLNETAERGIIVGLEQGKLCYPVYVPRKKGIILTRDVSFVEEPDDHLTVNEIDTFPNFNNSNPKHLNFTNESTTREGGRPRKPKNGDCVIQEENKALNDNFVSSTFNPQLSSTTQIPTENTKTTVRRQNLSSLIPSNQHSFRRQSPITIKHLTTPAICGSWKGLLQDGLVTLLQDSSVKTNAMNDKGVGGVGKNTIIGQNVGDLGSTTTIYQPKEVTSLQEDKDIKLSNNKSTCDAVQNSETVTWDAVEPETYNE